MPSHIHVKIISFSPLNVAENPSAERCQETIYHALVSQVSGRTEWSSFPRHKLDIFKTLVYAS